MIHFFKQVLQTFSRAKATKPDAKQPGLTDTQQPSETQTTAGTPVKAVPTNKLIKLSANFSLEELIRSTTAERLGIDNTPEQHHIIALRNLAEKVLQPVRNLVNRGVIVSSGFRSLELNRELKSEDSSQHRLGEAADINVTGMSAYELAMLIKESGIEFDQMILEFYTGYGTGWVHISRKLEGRNRKQVLTINKDGVQLGLINYD